MKLLRDWFERHFSNPQVVLLTILLVILTATIVFLASMLAPLVAAVVIAYLLQGLVVRLERIGIPHLAAVIAVFTAFLVALLLMAFVLLPLLLGQVTQLFGQLPDIMNQTRALLMELPERYPNFVTQEQADQFLRRLQAEVFILTQQLLSYSFSSLVAVITMLVYLILVPFLVFFLVKDRDLLVQWFTSFLPQERELATRVWNDVDAQIGNLVRGKAIEIMIVAAVTFVVFALFDLQFSALLAAITGLSVLVPYIGAAVVTLPVGIAAYLQWGMASEVVWVLIAYGIIQALDGNVLAPILFSEAVNLHPVAIIAAILLFGGLWGFWGVFFAVPLATVIQAVLRAWPKGRPAGRIAAQ